MPRFSGVLVEEKKPRFGGVLAVTPTEADPFEGQDTEALLQRIESGVSPEEEAMLSDEISRRELGDQTRDTSPEALKDFERRKSEDIRTAQRAGLEEGLTRFGEGVMQLGGEVADIIPGVDVDTKSFTEGVKLSRQERAEEAAKKFKSEKQQQAFGAGQVFGEAGPLMLVPGGQLNTVRAAVMSGAKLGGLAGATQFTESGDLLGRAGAVGAGAATGAAIGAVIGKIAEKAQAAFKSGSSRQLDEALQLADREGVKLDIADITGSKLAENIRSRLLKMPATMSKQVEQFAQKQDSFNKAVLKQAGIDANKATPEVIDEGFNRLGQKFDDLVGSTTLRMTDNVVDDLSNISSRATDELGIIAPEQAKFVDQQINKVIDLVQDGKITGEVYKRLRTDLNNRAQKFFRSQDKRELGEYVSDIVGLLDDQVGKSIGSAKQAAWKEARKQYANLTTLVTKNVINDFGDIGGKQLRTAIRNVNKKAFARGRLGDIEKLSRAGAKIAGNISDSGTAGNAAVQFAISGGAAVPAGLATYVTTGDLNTAVKNAIIFGAAPMLAQKGIQKVFNSERLKNVLLSRSLGNKTVSQTIKEIAQEAGGIPEKMRAPLTTMLSKIGAQEVSE